MIGGARKRLAIAVMNDRVGYVYCVGDNLLDWGMSVEAAKNIDAIFRQVSVWIRSYRPATVITEECTAMSRKGTRTRALIEAVGAAARDLGVKHEGVVRIRRFKNKYEEAGSIAIQYPELLDWIPKKRRAWETEPRDTIYFEAIALWLLHRGKYLPREKKPASGNEGTAQLFAMLGVLCESLL